MYPFTFFKTLPVASVTLAAVMLLSLTARAEWERQRMNPQDADKGFIAICAVSPTFAVAAGVIKQGSGDAAAVFVTRDGMNWANSSPVTGGGPLDIHIYGSCYFESEQHGYVGGIGEIWVTDDSAASWTKVGLGGLMSGRFINDIHGLGPGRPAYAAASTGQLLRSDDAGATWPEVSSPLGDVDLKGVHFNDDQHGWVWSGDSITDEESGEITGYEGGGLALTTDGGATWEPIFSNEQAEVLTVDMLNNSRGWLLKRSMSGTEVLMTTDGGQSWTPFTPPTESTAGQVVGYNDIHFFDGCEGIILGVLQNNEWGTVWRTTDGGESWVEADREFLHLGSLLGFPVEASMLGFDFIDRSQGWATGSNETIFRYDADDDAPDCNIDDGGGDADGDGDGDGGSGGERCSCRAPGSGTPAAPELLMAAALLGILWLRRRLG